MSPVTVVGLVVAAIVFIVYESTSNSGPRGGGTAVVCG